MPSRKPERLIEIREMVEAINFNNPEFKKALKESIKENENDFNKLRHWINKEGKDVYVNTWKVYLNKLREGGVTSRSLIQQYHHEYQNLYNNKMFLYIMTYLRKRYNM